MKRNTEFIRSGRNALFGLALLAIVSILAPANAQAAVSAGATIFNEASVTYDFLTTVGITQTSTGVTVTVDTLAAAPTITVAPLAQTTVQGGIVSYVYTILSNSNGPDTYTETAISTVNAGVGAPAAESFPITNITLWGGISVACQGVVANADELCIPAGAETGLGAGTVLVNGNAYTIGAITAGSPQASGSPEVTTKVQLVDNITTHGVAASTVAAGSQIGQYGTLTMNLTAGALTAPPAAGTHTTNVTFTTTGTDLAGNPVVYTTSLGDGNQVITTVVAPNVTFTKAASVATAKPGETITYTLVVTNNGTAAVDNVVVTDAAPAYTSLVAGSTTLNAAPVADITGGVTIGTLAAGGGTATITFQVLVNP